jgi:hypothetical protein
MEASIPCRTEKIIRYKPLTSLFDGDNPYGDRLVLTVQILVTPCEQVVTATNCILRFYEINRLLRT